MKKTVQKVIKNVQKNKLTNNTQKVGLKLLSVDGEWVPRYRLNRVPSGTSRVRDLRKAEFGGFQVECKSSEDLKRPTNHKTYYYRIDPSKVSERQVQTLFG